MHDGITYLRLRFLSAQIVCVPLALLLEGSKIKAAWTAATLAKGMTAQKLATTLAFSGWYLYTYNECELPSCSAVLQKVSELVCFPFSPGIVERQHWCPSRITPYILTRK
jgi:hypothetical protein